MSQPPETSEAQQRSSWSSGLATEQVGDHPALWWKPNALVSDKKLQVTGSPSSFPTLKSALAAAERRKDNNVVLLTLMSTGWVTFEYVGTSPCKVRYNELRLGGLPLGGDPFLPQTYLVDGSGQFAHIVHEDNRYKFVKIGRPSAEPPITKSWVYTVVPVKETNDGGNLVWIPCVTLAPALEELPSALVWIDQHMPPGTKVKAGGSRHAWSSIATTDAVYIAPERMKLMHTIDEEPNIYRAELGDPRRYLVRAGSGTTISEMNRFLWEHGKAFPLLGGFDGQTMGGVFNTGTHGSVLKRGPLAEMIVSIDLVCADGRMVRIEPAGGVTDPAALSSERPDLKLIQEDDYFNSALINMGTMGVVHSYMLEVTDAFHMKEVRTPTKMGDLKQTLRGQRIYSFNGIDGNPAEIAKVKANISSGKNGGFKDQPFPAYHLEFLFNPHSDKIIITSRQPVVANDAEFGFHPPGRDLIWTIERGAKFSRPAFPTWFQDRFTKLLAWGVNTLMKIFPDCTPHLVDNAMDTLVDKAYIDRSFNVFNVGDGQNRIPAFAGSIYVPIEEDKYIDALEVIQEVAKEFAARKRYATGPASMRFVKGTPALLGCPEDYCSFEFIFTSTTTWGLEMVEAYDRALRERFGHDVRGHWGQLLADPSPGAIRGMYPRYDRWRAIRDELDPDSRFLNDWQTKVLPP